MEKEAKCRKKLKVSIVHHVKLFRYTWGMRVQTWMQKSIHGCHYACTTTLDTQQWVEERRRGNEEEMKIIIKYTRKGGAEVEGKKKHRKRKHAEISSFLSAAEKNDRRETSLKKHRKNRIFLFVSISKPFFILQVRIHFFSHIYLFPFFSVHFFFSSSFISTFRLKLQS